MGSKYEYAFKFVLLPESKGGQPMSVPTLKKLELELVDGCIAVLSFNIPEKLNALDLDCHEDIHAFVDFLENTSCVRVGLIRSKVTRAFMSGIDIGGIAEGYFPPNRFKEAVDRIENCMTPVIAAINGYCLGGGVELAMGCDMRILADTAVLGLPEVSLGIIPGAGGIQRLARVAGVGIAKELALTSRRISAEEAHTRGLATRIVPADSLMDAALELARHIAAQAPLAVSLAKQAANIALDTDRTTAYLLEKWGTAIVNTTEDAREGRQAFAEKRSPRFKGH
jgi:enoyl-CoA hydratase